MTFEDVEDVEIRLLLEGVYRVHGHDFRDYAPASLRRRLTRWLADSPFATFSEAQARVLRDPRLLDSLVRGVTVTVSEMFRDPSFFKALRDVVVPHLKTYPFVKVWHAGCSTGEEAYSLAIVLHEEGLGGRFRLYATDINSGVLQKAEEGVYPLGEMKRFTEGYLKAGGKASFSDYYTAGYDRAQLVPHLKKNLVFASHNLAVDSGFGEMNLVLCRNVLIYFRPPLKDKVLELFDESLVPGGFLCLGLKETLERRPQAGGYREVAPGLRIYRKRYG